MMWFHSFEPDDLAGGDNSRAGGAESLLAIRKKIPQSKRRISKIGKGLPKINPSTAQFYAIAGISPFSRLRTSYLRSHGPIA